MSNKKYLKHFVRYDGSGKLIPGGNIRAPKAPKVGKWVEVNDNECCNPTTTTTTTAEPVCVTYQAEVGDTTAYISYTNCEGEEVDSFEVIGPATVQFCAMSNSYSVRGIAEITLVGEGCLTTTTTTTCDPLFCDFGLLYNWYAIDTDKLAPAGWHVPTYAEFETMRLYVASQGWNYDGTTDAGTEGDNKQGKALASVCKWTFNATLGAVGNTDYPDKRNISGFSGLPSGMRTGGGSFDYIETSCSWWSSTADGIGAALIKTLENNRTYFDNGSEDKDSGYSIRCLRDTSEGWEEGEQMEDYDGNLYDTVQIGTQIWTVQNLKTTHYNDGEAIPNVTDNTEWGALTTGACCAYNNDWGTYACVAEPTTTTTTTIPG